MTPSKLHRRVAAGVSHEFAHRAYLTALAIAENEGWCVQPDDARRTPDADAALRRAPGQPRDARQARLRS